MDAGPLRGPLGEGNMVSWVYKGQVYQAEPFIILILRELMALATPARYQAAVREMIEAGLLSPVWECPWTH